MEKLVRETVTMKAFALARSVIQLILQLIEVSLWCHFLRTVMH